MACTIVIENGNEALTGELPITATCRATGEIGSGTVKGVPLDLASAIAILGEEVVWERYLAQCRILWKSRVRPKVDGTVPKQRDSNKPKSVLEQLEEQRLVALAAKRNAA